MNDFQIIRIILAFSKSQRHDTYKNNSYKKKSVYAVFQGKCCIVQKFSIVLVQMSVQLS